MKCECGKELDTSGACGCTFCDCGKFHHFYFPEGTSDEDKKKVLDDWYNQQLKEHGLD